MFASSGQEGLRAGLYGLAIGGLAPSTALPAAPATWPVLEIHQRPLPAGVQPAPGVLRVGRDDAQAWVGSGVRVDMRREPLSAVVRSPHGLSDDALLHPYLALPALVANFWLGRQVMHGGAFSDHGRAWALLGGRGAGKSSTLAALLAARVPILSDDVLVIDGGRLFSGPPSIDLREDAAGRLGGEALGVLGSRSRWRLRPPTPPISQPLAGFVALEWASTFTATPLSTPERLALLLDGSEIALGQRSADSLLSLLHLPAYRVGRPRDLAQLAGSTRQLLHVLGAT